MKTIVKIIFAVIATIGSHSAFASQDEFCAGFAEGFKAVKGNMALLPLCPLAPLTPLGSTPYREGLKAGMKAGEAQN